MIRTKKLLPLLFIFTWVAGEAPRLWWKEAPPIRPMDVAAGLLFLAEIIRYKSYKNYKVVGLIIAAAILGPIAARTLVYGWLIWRGREIFGGVKKWIVPAMASFLVLGLGQYMFLPDMQFLLQYGWDEHYWRLIGTVLDPNYFGVMAGMILLSSLGDPRRHFFGTLGQEPSLTSSSPLGKSTNRVLSGFSSMTSKMVSSDLLMAFLSLVVLVLTFSRASWLAFAAAAGWWGLSGKSGPPSLTSGLLATIRRRPEERLVGGLGVPADFSDEKSGYVQKILGRLGILGSLGILGVAVWWAAPKPGGEGVNLMRTSSIEQRLVSWNQAIEVWKQHPWVGVGSKDHGSELPSSSWLVILQSVGIIGTIGVIVGGIRVIREIGENRFWMAVAMMLGIHAIFNNTLFYPPVLGLVAIMRAMDAK